MRKTEIEARLSAIKAELSGESECDINALETEVRALQAEKAEIDAKEKRTAMAKAINNGEIPSTKIEKPMEERKMENIFDTAEYRSGYFKGLQGKELTVEERTAVSGQSVIPTATMNKIVEKLEQTSVLYSKITVSAFPNKLSIPRENAKNDASWVAMGTASTDSADSFDFISLVANKLIKTIEIEADVEAMSIDQFEGYIVNALTKKMSKAVENAILNGTGTNQPTGLLKSGEITATGTFTKVAMTYKDLLAILAALPTSYHSNAALITTRAIFFNDIMGMVTTTGEPVVCQNPQAPMQFNVLGYPVIIDDYMATDTLLLGDLEYYNFNWAKPIEIGLDKSVGYRSGTTVYRALALADGKLSLDEAFVKYTRALS